MIHAFLFDLGNVLLHFSHARMCAQIARCCGLEADTVRQALFEEGLETRYECGAISTDEFHREFERLAGRPVDRDALRQAGCDIFWANDAMEPIVASLKSSGYPLVLISNINEVHLQWVEERFGVLSHFSERALSYRVGACKPSARIFAEAARLAGVSPPECFYVDDIPEYVEAARRLGFDAFHYRGPDALKEALAERGLRG